MNEVHQCPHCELRFGTTWELKDHSENSHAGPAPEAGWRTVGHALRKEYGFDTFVEAVAFVNRVAGLAEAADHHPDIDIRYNRVVLTLSSHDVGRITDRDHKLAAAIDA
jgi:4a-hydroxytetrahydrobiopterin dehydratase